MENFYDRWLKFWDESETARAQARKVIYEEELEWVETRQDKRAALLASPDNGFVTQGCQTMLVEIPEGSTIVDPLNNTKTREAMSEGTTEFRLKGKETLWFCTLVKMDGNQGWVEFKVFSQHGGTDTKRVNIRVEN